MSDTSSPAAQGHKSTLSRVWAGYLLSEVARNVWQVVKLDPQSMAVESTYRVDHGSCECRGFKSHLDCRHVKMVQHRPVATTRKKARQAATEVIESLEGPFDTVIDGYDLEDEDEDRVLQVRLRARGRPIVFDGRKHWTVLGVRKGVYVRVNIDDYGEVK
ncbi:MAG TPA: SWIM zinc finger family protein [Phycisphaerae bacterium]|nr:SWIM zinc finger family protein [Phycisphaerae bacterium]HUU59201.1 SWIM zinc finger family protein [Phycisphaerae bacterium]